MKKVMLVLFVLGISISSFAGLKEKDVVGSWKYEVLAGGTTMTGTMIFEKKEGKLTGEVQTDNGEVYPLTRVEIRDDNVLYFELQPDYDLMTISVTVDGKTFKGTIPTPEGDVILTGVKIK